MKANSQYEFYKTIEIVQDEVQTIEHNNSTEMSVNNQYEFFLNVKKGGFNISKGIGTNDNEIRPGNITEFMKLIKLDNEGNIKVKYK